MSPCRVVGLAAESLLAKVVEVDVSSVKQSDCSKVDLWNSQQRRHGVWSARGTHEVPVLAPHQALALYIVRRIVSWIAGLGVFLANAIVPKSRAEGTGHHDMKLGHASPTAPRYCAGFISTELKIAQVGVNGRAFASAWDNQKGRCEESLAKVLKCRGSVYGAAMLIVVGVCDADELLAVEPPLLVKAQLLTVDASRAAKWGNVVLERGLVPVEPIPPPAKRMRKGRSWDEVRAFLRGKEAVMDGVERVKLLDLWKAIGCDSKSPAQKCETYSQEKCLGLVEGSDYLRAWHPRPSRGKMPYWVSWAAAAKIYSYEVRRGAS